MKSAIPSIRSSPSLSLHLSFYSSYAKEGGALEASAGYYQPLSFPPPIFLSLFLPHSVFTGIPNQTFKSYWLAISMVWHAPNARITLAAANNVRHALNCLVQVVRHSMLHGNLRTKIIEFAGLRFYQHIQIISFFVLLSSLWYHGLIFTKIEVYDFVLFLEDHKIKTRKQLQCLMSKRTIKLRFIEHLYWCCTWFFSLNVSFHFQIANNLVF